MDEEQRDVWEEEIDLREVGRGIAQKWYIWVGIPLLVTILAAAYFFPQPEKFQLTARWTYKESPSELQDVQIDTAPPTVVRDSFRSSDLVEQVLRENPELEFKGDTGDIAVSLSRGVELESNNENNLVNIFYTTSDPVRGSKLINNWLDVFVQKQRKQFLTKLQNREETLQDRLDYLRDQFQDWRAAWSDFPSDSSPRVITTRLENAWSTYERAEKSPSKLREQLEITRSQLQSIQKLLKNEPKAFKIQIPLVQLSGAGISNRISEQLNDAYADLRQKRVDSTTEIASIEEELRQYEKKRKKSLNEIDRLQAIKVQQEEKYNRLEQRGETLRDRINRYEAELSNVQFLKVDLPDRFNLFYTEPPGEQLEQNGRRNTLLAGVVSFLLLFFGVAFWEIL